MKYRRFAPSLRRMRVAGGYRLLALAAILPASACSGASQSSTVPLTLLASTSAAARAAAQPLSKSKPYQSAVKATKPLAYFPFDTAKKGSLVGGYTDTLVNGAMIAKPGAPIGYKNKSLSLAGQQYATTSLSGGIPGSGSMVAWVNLSELPSVAGNYFYVSGESAGGNDFDLQFETDNALRFYTGSGEHTSYSPNPSSLVGTWNMIAVTYSGGPSGDRNIYWNGQLAASDSGNVDDSPKTSEFSVGESLVFTGRYSQGNIDEVAVWGRELSATEVANIYAAI